MTVELFTKLLERLPGAISLSRVDPATGKVDVLYLNPKGASVYGVPEDELRANAYSLTARMTPEGRDSFNAQTAVSLQTLAPFHWIGQIHHSNGEARWIE